MLSPLTFSCTFINDGLPPGRQAGREPPGLLQAEGSSKCTPCKRLRLTVSAYRVPFALLSQRLYVSRFMNIYRSTKEYGLLQRHVATVIQQKLGHASSLRSTMVYLRHIALVELLETLRQRSRNP